MKQDMRIHFQLLVWSAKSDATVQYVEAQSLSLLKNQLTNHIHKKLGRASDVTSV